MVLRSDGRHRHNIINIRRGDDNRGGARVQPGDADRGPPAAGHAVSHRGVGVVRLVGLGASGGIQTAEGRSPCRQPPRPGWVAVIRLDILNAWFVWQPCDPM